MQKVRDYVVGNGVHPINDEGVSSVASMFYLAGLVLWSLNIASPTLQELWNQVYPNEPRTKQQMAQFINKGSSNKVRPTTSPDDISLLAEDLADAGFRPFALAFVDLVKGAGVPIRLVP